MWSSSFNSCDPPGMSVCMYVCMRVNAVISSWSPSRLRSQRWLGGVWKRARPHTPHTWLQCLCPMVSFPQLYELRSEDTVLAVSYIGLYGTTWEKPKSSHGRSRSRWYRCMIWYCVFSLWMIWRTRAKRKKKIQDSVYNPNPLHRGIWDGEALALRLQK